MNVMRSANKHANVFTLSSWSLVKYRTSAEPVELAWNATRTLSAVRGTHFLLRSQSASLYVDYALIEHVRGLATANNHVEFPTLTFDKVLGSNVMRY